MIKPKKKWSTLRTSITVAITIVIGLPLIGFFLTVLRQRFAQSTLVENMPMTARMGDQFIEESDGMMFEQDSRGLASTSIETETSLTYPAPHTGFANTSDRTIVTTAQLSLLVKDPAESVTKIQKITTNALGFVTLSQLNDSDFQSGTVTATMTVRVPSAAVSQVLTDFKAIADKVQYEHISADDRTEQKVDIQAQLKNLAATESQLMTIMKQATTVDETLKVQRELSTVRDRSERLQAQLENLVGDSQMATISISLSTSESELPIYSSKQTSIWAETKLAVKDTIRLYRSLLIAGLKLTIMLAPVLVILAVAAFGWKKTQRN